MDDKRIITEARRVKMPRHMYDTPSARQALAKFAANQIPTTWLHHLLTGPNAVFSDKRGAHDNLVNVLRALRNELLPQGSEPTK